MAIKVTVIADVTDDISNGSYVGVEFMPPAGEEAAQNMCRCLWKYDSQRY